MKRSLIPVIICVFFNIAFAQDKRLSKPPKLSAEEILIKHRASVGNPTALQKIKSRIMVGVGTFSTKLKPGKIGGPAQFASDDNKVLLAILLNSNDYPFEKFAFDGKDLTAATLPEGGYSPLGDYLKKNKHIVKSGLMGGVLRVGGPAFRPNAETKFEEAGISKIDDRYVYKIRASTPGMGGMAISLFFDSDTFHHVRTVYFYRTDGVPVNPNAPLDPTAPRGGDFTLTEDFSNFASVDDLILPLRYVVEYTTNNSLIWTINFTKAYNNQPIDATVFRMS
jgi:hypothetical protein